MLLHLQDKFRSIALDFRNRMLHNSHTGGYIRYLPLHFTHLGGHGFLERGDDACPILLGFQQSTESPESAFLP